MNLIKSENLTLAYDKKIIIDKLSFEIDSGSYLCIVGENGTGKSTLIKGLLGLKKPSGGVLSLNGITNREIAYLPQKNDIQRDFPANVEEIVSSGYLTRLKSRLFFNRADRKIINDYLNQFGLEKMAKAPYKSLSGGQQQRVLIARALCSGARLIILDEPTASLDPIIASELYGLISHLNKAHNITIIMVSHDLEPALKYATHILQLGTKSYFYAAKEEYINSDMGRTYMTLKREA